MFNYFVEIATNFISAHAVLNPLGHLNTVIIEVRIFLYLLPSMCYRSCRMKTDQNSTIVHDRTHLAQT